MKSVKDRIAFAYTGSNVVRFHQNVGHRLNTDAHHSWGVAMMVYFLSESHPSVNLLMAALSHDLGEQVVGDIPYPAKRGLGIKALVDKAEDEALSKYDLLFPLTVEERRLLTIADTLDGMMYCASEAALGNKTLRVIYKVWLDSLQLLSREYSTHEVEVINAVTVTWREANENVQD